jgi:dipeptidyl aminopeptidase/acylaminoacyl peptidase
MKVLYNFEKHSYLTRSYALCLLLILICLLAYPVPARHKGAKECSSCTGSIGENFPTLRDLVNVNQVMSTQIAPNGKSLFYEVRKTDFDNNKYTTELWFVGLSGDSQPLKLTESLSTTSSVKSLRPQWSPDGKSIAYFSDRKGGSQIWRIIIDTRGEEQLTASDGWIGTDPTTLMPLSFKWSPDGKSIAFTAMSLNPPAKEAGEDERGKVADVYWGVNWTSRTPPPVNKLWLLDIATKKAKPLTGDTLNVETLNWSPDSSRIVLSARDKTSDSSFQGDIYSLDVKTGKVDSLLKQEGFDSEPIWSPDGKWIAFNSQHGKEDFLYRLWVAVIPAVGGSPVYLTEKFQQETGQMLAYGKPFWSADNSRIYFAGYYHMSNHLFRVPASGGEVEKVSTGDDYYNDFSFSSDGRRLAFTRETVNAPIDVFISETAKFMPKRVTDLNPQWRSLRLPTVECIQWKSKDGEFDVHGLLVKPPDFKKGTRYPLLVEIQGGPSMVAAKFNHGAFYPILPFALKGYAIFIPNTRGRGGYGDKFLRAIREKGDFHPGPYEDMMAGVEYLSENGIADPDRMGIMGFSYGAGLTAFAVTQTNRFKAASASDGMSDMVSAAFQAAGDPAWIKIWRDQFGLTNPWDPDQYREMVRQSAVYHVNKVKTPVLLEAGANSLVDQWRMLYQGLQRHKVTSQLVIYPRTAHGIQEPKLLFDSYRRNMEWFDQWVLGKVADTVK